MRNCNGHELLETKLNGPVIEYELNHILLILGNLSFIRVFT